MLYMLGFAVYQFCRFSSFASSDYVGVAHYEWDFFFAVIVWAEKSVRDDYSHCHFFVEFVV